jgi:hypothetical protein
MADEIKVIITGKDGVSKVFQEVAKSADSMQKAVTQDAAAAGTSINKMSADAGKAAADTSKSFGDMGRAFAVAGTTIGASIALFSRDIVTNQQNVATLTRTYGEAAGQLQAFAQQIQQSTTFSSESAIESANIFGTLARNYGVSVDQIQQLIQVSADLSATSGLSLEDTSQRVASAIRGEAEAAEALGLTMNQQAIDREGLTLTMSNQEAATFRINALMEQSSFATGAAGEKAATTAGKIAQLNNSFQDMARGAIAATGPLPQIVSGVTSIGASSGLAITGIASLAKGIRDASTAAGGLGPLLKGISSSGLGTGVALGGLAVAAGVAFVATRELSRAFDGSFYQSLNKGNAVAVDLNDTISQLTGTMNNAALAMKFLNIDSGLDQVGKDMNRIKELQMEIANPNTFGDDHTNAGILKQSEALQALQDELDALNAKYGDTEQAAGSWAAAQEDLGNILIHASAGSELAQQRALELSQAFNAGQITLADYAWQLNWITENYAVYDQQALSATVAQQDLNDKWDEGKISLSTYTDEVFDATAAHVTAATAVAEAADRYQELWIQVNLGKFAFKDFGGAAESAAPPTGRLVELVTGLGEAATRSASGVHELFAELDKFPELAFGDAETMTREFDHSASAAADTMGKLDESLLGVDERMNEYINLALKASTALGNLTTNAQLFAASGVKTPSLDVAVNLQGGKNALEDQFGAIVGQTNAMIQQMSGVKSWADTLIGDPGTWAKVDQLLTDGRISLEDYTQAQQAQITITQAQANSEQDLLAVQTMLAPVIAEATLNQARYIDSLQDLPEQQQLVALGYMDQAESAKALGLAQLAAASSTDVQRAATTQMIQQAAMADPVLKAMLEDMGLLSATDGSVNFDTNAVDIGTAIEGLTQAVQDLTDIIADTKTVQTDTNAPDTQGQIEGLHRAIDDIPRDVHTMITATDNASGTIDYVRGKLDALDGYTAHTQLNNDIFNTTYTNNVVSTTVGPGGNLNGRNGGAMGYANGGMVTAELAEVGTELARFANGGEALVPRHGLYSIPVGTNILPAPATKAELRRRGSDEGFHIGVLNIYPTTPDIGAEIRSAVLAGSRAR